MSYRFIYSNFESKRIVPSVLIDKRAIVPEISGQIGSVIKSFTDAQSDLVNDDTAFYKIETETGNLAGYFSIRKVRQGVVSLLQYELRPAFEANTSEISAEIATFISENGWVYDTLF